MSKPVPDHKALLAITIRGESLPDDHNTAAFRNSWLRWNDYLQQNLGLTRDEGRMLELPEPNRDDLTTLVGNFLKFQESRRPTPTDLLFYYVGHGD